MLNDDGMGITLKLMFWVLGALFIVMTTIGGSTASRLLDQNDQMIKRLTSIESAIAVEDVYNKDLDRRINNLEKHFEK